MPQDTFSSPGSNTWTAPNGCHTIKIECYGAGGGGGSNNGSTSGGGGGGGAYAKINAFSVTPGNTYNVYVGTGGAADTNGEDTTFNTSTCVAKGGNSASLDTAGSGGSSGSSTGDVKFSGGSGANGASLHDGGGGGGGAGNSGNGGSASGFNHGTGGSPDGGPGGDGDQFPVFGGTPGNPPGGGGGGEEYDGSGAYSGGDGLMYITYTIVLNRKSPTGGVAYMPYSIATY